MMKTVTVKELRRKFPRIREGLLKGQSYLIVFRSIPLGKLEPVDPENLILKKSSNPPIIPDDDYLSGEELNYYLNLKCRKEKSI